MPPLDPTTLRCPSCGAGNLRLSRRRSPAEAGPSGLAACRYRCREPDCGWRGSQTSPSRWAAAVWRAAAEPARRVLLGLGLLAAVGVLGGVLLVSGLETWGRHVAGLDTAPGRSHDGLPLAPASRLQGGHALLAQATVAAAPATPAGLTLRQGCAWGQPGRNPYRGSTEQALTAAGLPPEVVRQIAAQRQAGHRAGRLQISRDAIRLDDGSRAFNPRQMAMSFGTTLCLNSRVNFAPGHVEAADLFEARDEQGRVHAVMVPGVCGNVTVLQGTRAAGGVVAGVSAALADRSLALASVAAALAAAPSDPGTATAGGAGAGAADGGHPGSADEALPQAPARNGPDGAELKARPVDGEKDAQPAGTQRALAPLAGPGGSGSGSTSSGGGGSLGNGGPGSAGEPAGAQRDGRATAWVGLGTSGLTRTVLVAGLNNSASLLAKASSTIAALPVAGGDPGIDLPSMRQNNLDAQSIPEPGTLLCVLAALAGLVWVGRRGG